MSQMTNGAPIAAVISREKRMSGRGGRVVRLDEHLRVAGLHAAVTALARLEVDDGFEEMAAAEVRPEHLGHVDLGVGDLPEQEVRHAQLAAGADEQVGI